MFLNKFFNKQNNETISFEEILKPEGSALKEHVITNIKKETINQTNTSKQEDVTMENILQMNENENKEITLLEKATNLLENLLKGQEEASEKCKPKKETESEVEENTEMTKIQAELVIKEEMIANLTNEKELLSNELNTLKQEKITLETKISEYETEKTEKEEELVKAQYTAKAVNYIGLSGTPEEIGEKLRKIDAIEDEELRNELLENLKKESEENASMTQENGTEQGALEINSDDAILNKAKKISEETGREYLEVLREIQMEEQFNKKN